MHSAKDKDLYTGKEFWLIWRIFLFEDYIK